MKLVSVLTTEIPKTYTARALVGIASGLAFLFVYGFVALVPDYPGPIPGEAAIALGGLFMTLGPLVLGAVSVSCGIASWQKPHLSRPWFLLGFGPLFSLLPALTILYFRVGAWP
ncbi:MAG: hypothetical protein AAFY88_04700 [Acidobacteriota bacterium]